MELLHCFITPWYQSDYHPRTKVAHCLNGPPFACRGRQSQITESLLAMICLWPTQASSTVKLLRSFLTIDALQLAYGLPICFRFEQIPEKFMLFWVTRDLKEKKKSVCCSRASWETFPMQPIMHLRTFFRLLHCVLCWRAWQVQSLRVVFCFALRKELRDWRGLGVASDCNILWSKYTPVIYSFPVRHDTGLLRTVEQKWYPSHTMPISTGPCGVPC